MSHQPALAIAESHPYSHGINLWWSNSGSEKEIFPQPPRKRHWTQTWAYYSRLCHILWQTVTCRCSTIYIQTTASRQSLPPDSGDSCRGKGQWGRASFVGYQRAGRQHKRLVKVAVHSRHTQSYSTQGLPSENKQSFPCGHGSRFQDASVCELSIVIRLISQSADS